MKIDDTVVTGVQWHKDEVGGGSEKGRDDVAKTGGENKILGYKKIQIRTHHKGYIYPGWVQFLFWKDSGVQIH